MGSNSKMHPKFNKANHTTVSIQSLLGVLSSAYGTEELDPSVVFDSNAVNWSNISVENIKSQAKKEIKGSQQNSKQNDLGRISVSTSTSSLKSKRNFDSEVDVTLFSIKSLDDIKQSMRRAQHNSDSSKDCAVEKSVEEISSDLSDCSIVENGIKGVNDSDEVISEPQRLTVCGFFVEGSSQEVIFDIQFFEKSNSPRPSSLIPNKSEIHLKVTDEVNDTQSFINVSKTCLILKSQYFAEVDKEFGLENLEVCVICDSSIFQQAMEWVRSDTILCKPKLCTENIKHTLTIAYHLGIEDLVDRCLDFISHNINSVLQTDCDVQRLIGEKLLVKFSKLLNNSAINDINDEFESFKMNLFSSLIQLLGEEVPFTKVGHFSSLASIFQCTHCQKFLSCDLVDMIPCTTVRSQLDFKGDVKYHHECSPYWNLTVYIELAFKELQSWQRVYWHLWGLCHFQRCSECNTVYPMSQSEWCPYHPDPLEYFPIDQDHQYPVGCYGCCGEKGFRFNVLQPYGGCKYKSHTPFVTEEKRQKVHSIYETNKDYVSSDPSINRAMRFVKFVKQFGNDEPRENYAVERFRWQGILLAPKTKPDHSIISRDVLVFLRNKQLPKRPDPGPKPLSFQACQVHLGVMPLQAAAEDHLDSLSKLSPVQCKQDRGNQSAALGAKKKKTGCNPSEPTWKRYDSIQCNQDIQRDCEELAMRRLVNMLAPAPPGFVPAPTAGTYLRLEAERCNFKASGTVVNRTFPLAWFRRQN